MGSDGSIEGTGLCIGGGSGDIGRDGSPISLITNGGGSGCIGRDIDPIFLVTREGWDG